jgi:hypothetical protein
MMQQLLKFITCLNTAQHVWASSCPSSGVTTTAVAASGLPSELGNSSAVGRGRAGRPTALLLPNSDGKPDAATAVVVTPDDGHEDARIMLSCI